MKQPRPLVLLAAFFFLQSFHCAWSAQLLDDRAITIRTTRDVAEKRRALIRYIWGEPAFPGGVYRT